MKKMRILQIAVLLAVSGAAGAADHLYELNSSLADTLGGPALVDHGGIFNDTSYIFGKNEGLTLPDQLGGVYTIDMVMTFDTHNGWQKIIDFNGLASDAGMYTYGSQWNFFPVSGYTATPADGEPARLTLTRDASSNLSIYVNGSLIGAFNDAGGLANFGTNSANFFIDDHATGQNEATSGNVDYIRTFDHALTADEVGRLEAPAAPVPEPPSIAMLGAGLGLLVFLRRRTRTARKP